MNRRERMAALVGACACALAYAMLGRSVSHAPPGRFDSSAEGLAGHGVPIAWVFTESCLWPALVTLGILALALAAKSRTWRERAMVSIVMTVLAWQTSDVLKNVFMRPRPVYWTFHRETSFSYSSGHALFATIVYALWAFFVYRSALPGALRATLASLAALWALGVLWSRLALGAHYLTDLIGGVLLGVVFIGIACFLRPRIVDVPFAGKTLGTIATRKTL